MRLGRTISSYMLKFYWITSYMASEVSTREDISLDNFTISLAWRKYGTIMKKFDQLEDRSWIPRTKMAPNLECLPHWSKSKGVNNMIQTYWPPCIDGNYLFYITTK